MLDEILENAKTTLPDAFVEGEIPSIENLTDVKSIQELFPEIADFPSPNVFVDPHGEAPQEDPELESDVRERGIDTLAWYISFHQSTKWGIYIRVRGISFLLAFFQAQRNFEDRNRAVKAAFDTLFYHEFFHFLTDIVSVHMEMSYKKALHNDYLSFKASLTDDYFNIEEALANAYVLRKSPRLLHSVIKKFFKIQPEVYRRYSEFTSNLEFIKGKRKLGAIIRLHSEEEIVQQALANSFPGNDEPFWEFVFNVEPEGLFVSSVPLYIVFEKHPNSDILRFIRIYGGARIAAYPCDHPPPHIHVWIPPHSRNEGRYEYPSLHPLKGSSPLGNKQRQKVEGFIEQNRERVERIVATHITR